MLVRHMSAHLPTVMLREMGVQIMGKSIEFRERYSIDSIECIERQHRWNRDHQPKGCHDQCFAYGARQLINLHQARGGNAG